jgi:transposase-like protein
MARSAGEYPRQVICSVRAMVDRDLFGEPVTAPRSRRVGRRIHLAISARQHAEELRRQGASVAAIAEALGIAETTAWHRLAAELDRGLPGGRVPGRPRWQPTPEDLAEVIRLTADGVTLDQLCVVLGVTTPTLRRHCSTELAAGRAQRGRPNQTGRRLR